jgi:hypothetical protein
MEIGAPDFLSQTGVFLVKIPERILSIVQSSPCTLISAGDSLFYLIGPAGERLGEFKASFMDQGLSCELLKQTTPTACFPVLDDVNTLTFKSGISRTEPLSPHVKKKAISAASRQSGLRTWSAPRTFRSLKELRERFDSCRGQAYELLLEMQQALARPMAEFDPKAMRTAFNDIIAFTVEQEACMKAAKALSETFD